MEIATMLELTVRFLFSTYCRSTFDMIVTKILYVYDTK